jgi:hypothetical protein
MMVRPLGSGAAWPGTTGSVGRPASAANSGRCANAPTSSLPAANGAGVADLLAEPVLTGQQRVRC